MTSWVRLALLAGALLTAAPAQAAGYRAPRTRFGAPDLQGQWTNSSFTNLVRPKDFKALVATPEEAAAYVAKVRNPSSG